MFTVEYTTIASYNFRSNGQAERFVDTYKRVLRKANKEVTNEVGLQQFLKVYRATLLRRECLAIIEEIDYSDWAATMVYMK